MASRARQDGLIYMASPEPYPGRKGVDCMWVMGQDQITRYIVQVRVASDNSVYGRTVTGEEDLLGAYDEKTSKRIEAELKAFMQQGNRVDTYRMPTLWDMLYFKN